MAVSASVNALNDVGNVRLAAWSLGPFNAPLWAPSFA